MQDTSGFFRIDPNGVFQHAPNFVYGPGYSLRREDHAGYSYPTTGGWRWFDDLELACTHFNLNYEEQLASMFPQPEPAE
jgi:hypothetical protein